MRFKRTIEDKIKEKFFSGKVIIIVGARQVGKTTLGNRITEGYKTRVFNCDNPTERALLNNKDIEFLKGLVKDTEIIFIDEAQKVKSIGETLKLLVEHFKDKKQIIVTGSSSINLLDKTQEPLTGRKYVFNLFPLSLDEIYKDKLELIKMFEQNLIFGSYPEVAKEESFDKKIELLKELSTSYLYKDIFEFQEVKNPDLIFNLLKALALQIGNEVSYNGLSNILGVDKKTVERYVNLLEKNFIVFRLSPFTKNKRREISKLRKIYFFDLGIRNAIINNFNFIESRGDAGQLFENFCILERMKYREYNKIYVNQYFWRTYDGAEVDLVEERSGKLFAFEFKFRKSSVRKHAGWNNYTLINKDNISDLLK